MARGTRVAVHVRVRARRGGGRRTGGTRLRRARRVRHAVRRGQLDRAVTAASGDRFGTASFSWTVSASGTGCTAGQRLGNPGFETGRAAPWATSAGVIASGSSGQTPHKGRWYA